MNNANFNNALTGGLLLFLLVTLHLPFPHPPGSGLFLPSNIVAWATMAYSCLIVCLAVMLPRQQTVDLSFSPLTRRLALVTVMLAIPLLYSPEMWWMDGAVQWLGVAGGFAFYFCLVQARLTLRHHRLLLGGIAAAALFQAIVGALYLLVWLPETGEWYASGQEIGGVLLQNNVTATFLMIGMGAALLLLLEPVYRTGKLMRGLLMFTLMALSFMLVHLQSRIGLLDGLVSLVCFGLCYGRREPVLSAIALGSVLTGVALAFALIIFAPAGHLDLVHEASNRYRLQMLRETWKMVELHPLAGWGLGSFGYHYSQFLVMSGIASQESVVVQHPHNEWLFGWAEGGLVTVLAYLILLVTGWQLWRQTRRRDTEQGTTFRRGLWILLLPMLLHTQVEYPFYLSTVLWLIFLLLLALLDGVSYGSTGASSGTEQREDDRYLLSATMMCAGGAIAGFISLLALLYMLTGLQSGLMLSSLERAQVKNTPERAMHADLDAIHRTLWNPWIFEERFEFDRQLENLLRFNTTRDPRLLLGYLSWSSRYLAVRFNPDVFAARMMILDAAGRHSQAQRIRTEARLLYPRDIRFIPAGEKPLRLAGATP